MKFKEQGPLLIVNELSGKSPDFTVTINRKNIAQDPETSFSDDVLHFVHVLVKVPEKVTGNTVRKAGMSMLKLPLKTYADVIIIKDLLMTRKVGNNV